MYLNMYHCTERVHENGGGSGQLRLRAGGAKNLLVKRATERGSVTKDSDLQRHNSNKR